MAYREGGDPNPGPKTHFVTTQPEQPAAAAGDLQRIGSAMNAHNAIATALTTGVIPAAADEVSELIAAQFAAQAAIYQEVSIHAAAIHELLVTTLATNARTYAATEAANTSAIG
ncbi:PE family protein [Mycobacterium gastri]|uniref:PE family protein n=1 Tax=Mycobacterium gastri TaxID=1777 RepID=A0A1X1V9H9_MYCGS|nr:PE family protein [Mycobacterium gastri]ORV65720.1 PE family protein [Mycobacterium gastri]